MLVLPVAMIVPGGTVPVGWFCFGCAFLPCFSKAGGRVPLLVCYGWLSCRLLCEFVSHIGALAFGLGLCCSSGLP